MRLLTFQVRRFEWQSHSRTLEHVADREEHGAATDAVVAFMHIESRDEGDRRASVLRKTLKHIKWVANKRELRAIVLHSFTHLGGVNASPVFAEAFMEELLQRLEGTGYGVQMTPFGYFSAWSLDVFGESMAKVYKDF